MQTAAAKDGWDLAVLLRLKHQKKTKKKKKKKKKNIIAASFPRACSHANCGAVAGILIRATVPDIFVASVAASFAAFSIGASFAEPASP